MSRSSQGTPRSAATRAMTVRASSHRWQPGRLSRVIVAAAGGSAGTAAPRPYLPHAWLALGLGRRRDELPVPDAQFDHVRRQDVGLPLLFELADVGLALVPVEGRLIAVDRVQDALHRRGGNPVHDVDQRVRLPDLHLLHDLGGEPLELFRGLVKQGVDRYLPVEPGGVLAGQRTRQRVVLPQGRQHVTGLHEAAAVHGSVLAVRDLFVRVPARGLGTRADLAVGGLARCWLVRHVAGGRAGDAVAAVTAIGGVPAGAPFLAARPEPASEVGVGHVPAETTGVVAVPALPFGPTTELAVTACVVN